MARKTLREIARLLQIERVNTPGAVPEIKLISKAGDKALVFVVAVTIGAATHDVAGDNGKIKSYKTADDVVKAVAKYLPTNDGGYMLNVETGLVLVASIPADLKKDAASKIVKFGTVKAGQQAMVTEINAEIALMAGWENGNALQVARLAETTAQKNAVVEDIAAIDALIAYYTVIANS